MSFGEAKCFLDNPNQYKYVRYINGDIKNCDVSNLEWGEYEISSSPRITQPQDMGVL